MVTSELWGICIKTDGAVPLSTNLGSAGGLFRDHEGNFLSAFNKQLGTSSVLQAELWGVLEGLKLVLKELFRWIMQTVDFQLMQREANSAADFMTKLNVPQDELFAVLDNQQIL
ncbi:hypothetical protein F3Y22_tig00110332pilonHSYRG00184 [Hibiscus syriacus]|uniref:RNase H type-1 domain-containing protein n=1 Tax=Hibiscus syriacus TaxID=106335 RepID=A0A6A3B0B6_HIBSY|nr:hypothetical protein F3Y22_tig00110332pilonHSYRG00184 [Hibiscus syriacus]